MPQYKTIISLSYSAICTFLILIVLVERFFNIRITLNYFANSGYYFGGIVLLIHYVLFIHKGKWRKLLMTIHATEMTVLERFLFYCYSVGSIICFSFYLILG